MMVAGVVVGLVAVLAGASWMGRQDARRWVRSSDVTPIDKAVVDRLRERMRRDARSREIARAVGGPPKLPESDRPSRLV